MQQKIGQILVGMGKATREQINEALKQQQENGLMLGTILMSMDIITEDDLLLALKLQKNKYATYSAFPLWK